MHDGTFGLLAWVGLGIGYALSVRTLLRSGSGSEVSPPRASRGPAEVVVLEDQARRPPPRRGTFRRWAVRQPTLTRTTMRISDLLPPELVLPAVLAQGKGEVMELLAARLAGHYPEIDGGQLAVALRERDRHVSTALA
ncbi:MAG: hypothetical protein ACREQL_08490, partial [Candidatus Binatia bacterium]